MITWNRIARMDGMTKSARVLGFTGLLFVAVGACAQTRYSPSPDGSEVTDNRTGLVWKRCVEGMIWSGTTCTGTASTFGQEAALALSTVQVGWRLPNVKELSSIADRTRLQPAADPAAFPATPASLLWSSTPVAGNASNAWLVDFNSGGVTPYLRFGGGVSVRLVRSPT